MLYATDASLYQVEPLAVVVPRTIDDVRLTVEFAAARGLPLLPRGGGTSLAGQTVNRAVVIDFSRWCTRVREVDVERRLATVEPGVVLDDLNAAVAAHDLMFGPDVATRTHAALGGMIGNNSAGAYSVLYGRTVEHLDAVDVLLADGSSLRFETGAAAHDPRVASLTERVAGVVRPLAGEIRARFPKTRRRVDGYNLDLVLDDLEASSPGTFDRVNLAKLVCGSEGTLAVTTSARVRLVDTPRARGLAIVAFGGVDDALVAVESILETGPAAVELIDDVVLECAKQNRSCRPYVDLLPRVGNATPKAVLYVEYFGADDEGVAARFEALDALGVSEGTRTYTGSAAMHDAWTLRRSGEPLLHALPGPRKALSFIEDLAVDPTRLADFVRDVRTLLRRRGTKASYYAHASVGCLHIRPMVDLRDDRDREMFEAIAQDATDLVVKYGGALSGEHGDGRARSALLERFYGPRIVEAFRDIKAIFDPQGRLNPGNIVDPQPIALNLRARPGERDLALPQVDTYFRWEAEHGFGAAVEQCNGAGVCRRTKGGTMCPSYRALRDERHATRGRGNALRLAISGQLTDGAPDWNDEETRATLDLCLSCKACGSECPSNVDVAKLKAEYLAQGYARAGAPLSARVFSRVRQLNVVASMAPRLAEFAANSEIGRAVLARCLDIDRRRSLPAFGVPLRKRMGGRGTGGTRPAVVLLPDCFCAYGESDIGLASVRVLEHIGFDVHVPSLGCCGRPAISTGLLAEARRTIGRTATALSTALRETKAVAVVGAEPSCVSALRDEWLDLDLAVDRSALEEIAEKTQPIEDFVAGHLQETHDGAPVVVHGHCHQKALGSLAPTVDLLRRVSREVTLLDTGCCGMAGSFGYTRGHYDVSVAIAESELLPALAAHPDARIAAAGTSCRHQICDLAGRRAMHPVSIVQMAIAQKKP